MHLKTIAWICLALLMAITVYAIIDVGLMGIFGSVQSSGALQIFIDLVVALVLVLTWLIKDARQNDRNPWPWVVATLFTGSIAPLVYIVTGKSKPA